MLPETPAPVEPIEAEAKALGAAVRAAIAGRYDESEAARFGIGSEGFESLVASVVWRYAADSGDGEQIELVRSLRVAELALARACTAGNETAWDEFLRRFRSAMYETACRVTRDPATGRELADGLYAELYGLPNREGRRVSKLDYYMGRGSLEGWLRSVLAQQHVNRCRTQAKTVSLEEQVEQGAIAHPAAEAAALPQDAVTAAVGQVLAELGAEERFLLASYFLDRRTLKEIGQTLRVHESTVCRKLERLTGELRKRVRKRWMADGLSARRCEELLMEIDVRDIDLDVGKTMRIESSG